MARNEIDAQRLWERITVEERYQRYPHWPGHEGIRRSQAPHGSFHRIYINSILRDALPCEIKTVPEGGIIVKENFDSERRLGKVSVMAKIKGYNPEAGDWFWALFQADGTVIAAGKPKGCIECHAAVEENDYILVRDLAREVDQKEERDRAKRYRID